MILSEGHLTVKKQLSDIAGKGIMQIREVDTIDLYIC